MRATALVGIYRWEAPDTGTTFVRFSFAADAQEHDAARPLDAGIVRALWLTYEEIVARRADHRSPLVLRCVDDYRAGARWPLDFVREISMQRGCRTIERVSGEARRTPGGGASQARSAVRGDGGAARCPLDPSPKTRAAARNRQSPWAA